MLLAAVVRLLPVTESNMFNTDAVSKRKQKTRENNEMSSYKSLSLCTKRGPSRADILEEWGLRKLFG